MPRVNDQKTKEARKLEKKAQKKTKEKFEKLRGQGKTDHDRRLEKREAAVTKAKDLLQQGLMPAAEMLLSIFSAPNELTKEEHAALKLKLEAAKHAIKLNGLELEQHMVAQVEKEEMWQPLVISRG